MKTLCEKLKHAVHLGYHSALVLQEIQRLEFTIRHDQLMEKALRSDESGVSSQKLCEYEVIVSLTTYGKRLYDVAPTIESIMQGSVKPNRIVLWLEEEMKDVTLPIALRKQQERGLEIVFCKNVRSYKKLIPAFGKYPTAAIITIDDDAIYHYDLVEKLVNAHKLYPKDIIANRVHRMVLGENSKPVSYMKWDWCVNLPVNQTSPLLFLTGVGGVFYPPKSLSPEVMNEAVFMDICKFADDVWFNAMALMAGTKIRKCYTHDAKGEDYLINVDVQDVGLLRVNTGKKCANDRQLCAVFEKYNLWDKLNA